MQIDVWLYGALSLYGKEKAEKGFALVTRNMPDAATVADLMADLEMPSQERGITFINGNLSALPGLQPDLNHRLADGDRVSFFDLRSMWPFQYRHGAAMVEEMNEILNSDPEQVMHHIHDEAEE